MTKTIAITGDKGGVGKSTISALLAQWFCYNDYKVNILDADPNRTVATWLDKCKEQSYNFCTLDNPELLIIDTAGTSGSSLIKYVKDADLIIVPFQPHIADLEVVIGWFLSIKESLQSKVLFLPNRKENTNEQKEGLAQVIELIQSEGHGLLLGGLANRPAIYSTVLNGLAQNYFATLKDVKTHEEINTNFSIIKELLFGK